MLLPTEQSVGHDTREFQITSLLGLPAGGVGLFLLGMWLITEGLKLLSGSALRTILESWSWTRTSLRGFAAGFFIAALVQSSSTVRVQISLDNFGDLNNGGFLAHRSSKEKRR